MNVVDILVEHAVNQPDHPAIEDGDDRIVTYSELLSMVNTAAVNLCEAGIEKGDYVAVRLPDSTNNLVIMYALAKTGAVLVPIDPALSQREQEQTIRDFDVKGLVARTGTSSVANISILPVSDICTHTEPVTKPSPINSIIDFDAEQPFVVCQSSGSTGTPKHILLTHEQVLWRINRPETYYGMTPSDRYLSLLNLSYNYGRERCMKTLQRGATVVINRRLPFKDLINYTLKKKITLLMLMPAHIRQLLASTSENGAVMPAVKIVTGSSPTANDERLQVRQRLTPDFVEAYATTETGVLALALPEDQDTHPESVGRLTDKVEAQIVDEENQLLPTGSVGQIRFRLPHLPHEYVNNPEASAKAFRAGWFYPGDLAAINEDGYIFLKGRADDIIDSSGSKFYPLEVENVLLAHPAVKEAAVIGWRHKILGMVATACVVLNEPATEDELRKFCATQLASYKVPNLFIFLKSMPRNRMDKIAKRRLKKTINRKLGRQL